MLENNNPLDYFASFNEIKNIFFVEIIITVLFKFKFKFFFTESINKGLCLILKNYRGWNWNVYETLFTLGVTRYRVISFLKINVIVLLRMGFSLGFEWNTQFSKLLPKSQQQKKKIRIENKSSFNELNVNISIQLLRGFDTFHA